MFFLKQKNSELEALKRQIVSQNMQINVLQGQISVYKSQINAITNGLAKKIAKRKNKPSSGKTLLGLLERSGGICFYCNTTLVLANSNINFQSKQLSNVVLSVFILR